MERISYRINQDVKLKTVWQGRAENDKINKHKPNENNSQNSGATTTTDTGTLSNTVNNGNF